MTERRASIIATISASGRSHLAMLTHLAHEGWLVFDNPVTVKASIEAGHMISHWTPRKRAAVLAWLNGKASGTLLVS
jgi:hypothetical protein